VSSTCNQVTALYLEHSQAQHVAQMQRGNNYCLSSHVQLASITNRMSCSTAMRLGSFDSTTTPRILLVDFGVKSAQIDCLLQRGSSVIVIPHNFDLSSEHGAAVLDECNGVMLSSGPGDPMQVAKQCNALLSRILEHCQQQQQQQPLHTDCRSPTRSTRPVLGICLGHQLLAIAAGMITSRLRCGHRSNNQPCTLADARHSCVLTEQNHGMRCS
jgi:carbamoylphosphate synthase small subunit